MALDHGTKHIIGAEEFQTFMFLGRARFTLENIATGNYITYHIKSRKVKRDQPPETRFFEVYVTALGDGVQGKVHVGEIDRVNGTIRVKEGIKPDYVGLVTIKWILNHWRRLNEFVGSKMNAYHLNSCSKCGLELTVPESIQDGIGPICIHTKMKQTLAMLKELGMVLQDNVDWQKDANYDKALELGVATWPDKLDKFFVPTRLRKKEGFISNLYELDKFGLW